MYADYYLFVLCLPYSYLADRNVQLAQTPSYNYHPAIPLPDPEAPEQSLGDCSICMDAILVDPSLRQKGDDEKEQLLGLGRWGQAANMRKSYSLAPCHHLFVCVPLFPMLGCPADYYYLGVLAHSLSRESTFDFVDIFSFCRVLTSALAVACNQGQILFLSSCMP